MPSMQLQHYVLLILRYSRLARKSRESLRAFNAFSIGPTRNVATAQNYNSRKFGLKM